MSFYGNLAATALKLLTKYGYEVTFTHVEQGAFDPDTLTTSDVTSTYTATIVKDEYSTLERQSSAIKQGDIKLICTHANFNVSDTVAIDGIDYRIMDVSPIKPAQTILAYELQVGR